MSEKQKEELEILMKNAGGEGKTSYKDLIKGGSSGFNAEMSGYMSSKRSFYHLSEATLFWSFN